MSSIWPIPVVNGGWCMDRAGPLSSLMAEGALAMVYQPIVSLTFVS